MTKCTNCKTGIDGVSYTFNDETFCGKSCLVRYLLEEKLNKIALILEV